MAYIPYDPAVPDPTTQNGTVAFDATRENDRALRDAIINDSFPGWDMSVIGGTPEEPAAIQFSKSATEHLRQTLLWANGNVYEAVYEYTTDNWVTVPADLIGQLNITYDANHNVTSTIWS